MRCFEREKNWIKKHIHFLNIKDQLIISGDYDYVLFALMRMWNKRSLYLTINLSRFKKSDFFDFQSQSSLLYI
jgi:hypothetical protein